MRYGWFALAAIAICNATSVGWAATKPIDELDDDVTTWSTMPLDVPKTMVDVGKQEGPLSAVMWGPAKGTAVFIRSLTAETWKTLKPERETTPGVHHKDPVGPVLRYEF